jgi:agmatinase
MDEPVTIPQNFLGLPEPAAARRGARVVVLPIPFEATVSYGTGTRDGPAAILAASRQVETFDPASGQDLAEARIHTASPLAPDLSAPGAMDRRIRDAAAGLLAEGAFLLALGGEHSITAPLVEAVAAHHADVSVLHVDAHLDLRAAFDGTPYSHASVMRRVVEAGHRTVHVGIRSACPEEAALARDRGLPVFWGRRCAEDDGWIAEAVDALGPTVYLSLDLDGLDPSVIRAVGTPEPGGLTWWQAVALVDRVFAERRVVAADVVELAPSGDRASDFAAARLAVRVAGLALRATA